MDSGNYLHLNHKYLKEAEKLIKEEDWVQASEKFWGAAATMVKSVASKRGVNIRSHRELYKFVAKLKSELKDSDLTRWFGLAGALHQNFYENWLPPEMVVDYGESVKQLVEKLEALMEEPASGADEDGTLTSLGSNPKKEISHGSKCNRQS